MKKINLLRTTGFFTAVLLLSFSFMSCYSVFSGGTGGQIVDAESSSNPKAGIANVEVYAYTNATDRNNDYKKWKEGTVFVPHADYYGHTTSGANGGFTISKLVWKSMVPEFGKDADFTEIYLLFYHENYGLTKGSTVITSDSATDTVYAELTKVRKETAISLNFVDVSADSTTGETVYVEISVPQTTATITDAAPKVYKGNITGSGVVTVSYPRWLNETDRKNGIENKPEVTVTYYQNADVITWKGCYNGDSENDDYAFRVDSEGKTVVTKKIGGSSYGATFYGKRTRFSVPEFNGQWGTANGVTLSLYRSTDGGSTYSVFCGSTETFAQNIGTAGTQKNGAFAGLGGGLYWFDSSYTDKISSGFYKITDGSASVEKAVDSNRTTVTIQKS